MDGPVLAGGEFRLLSQMVLSPSESGSRAVCRLATADFVVIAHPGPVRGTVGFPASRTVLSTCRADAAFAFAVSTTDRIAP
jgi:hypothetical protein